jgi:hypothetical protein
MIYYYEDKNEGRYRVYDDVTFEYSWEDDEPSEGFFVFKGYDCTDKGLIKFCCHFKDWCEQLKDNKIWKVDYLKSFKSNYIACEVIFSWLQDRDTDEFEDIDCTEFGWIERCNNGALIKLIVEPGTVVDSFGYDFKLTYPTILGSKLFRFDIPCKRGKEMILQEIDFKKLARGYYRVLICSDDINFNKVFNYSKHHVYTDISLYQAYKCGNNGMKVKIELIQDGKPNAYVYDKVVTTSSIFGKWYQKLSKLREEFPDNQLIKHLMSSAWGRLSQFNKKYLTFDEIIKNDLSVTMNLARTDCDYFMIDEKSNGRCTLVNAKKPYKYIKLARIKRFLLAQARMCTANIALMYIDDVIRIHTDNVTFNKKHDDVMTKYKTYPELRIENKTTGLMKWNNVKVCERVETDYLEMKEQYEQILYIEKLRHMIHIFKK